MKSTLSINSIGALALVTVLLFSAATATAQLERASPPIADPNDHRFQGVEEDWTSPSLTTSHLVPVHPLSLQVSGDNPHYTVELLRVQWRWGDPIDLYVMKPAGVKKPPVILYLNGYPTSTDIFRNDAYEELVTKDGFAAVGFVTALTGHRYHDRPMKQWFLSELQESLATSTHDLQMVLNYLETRGDLDMNRVGIFAQGSGASVAILASSVDPRIKVLEALDPWADWPVWIATSPFPPANERADYLKPEFLKKVTTLEPLAALPKIQAKNFRLDQEQFDPVTPKSVKEKLQAAAPAGSVVLQYKNMDELKPAFENGNNLSWIQHELKSLPSK
jgi:hypothetical protein